MKQALKEIIQYIAKTLAIFFALVTFILIIISLIKPDWIKDAVVWIGELVKILGDWNYLVAFLSACIESLPIIGTAVPGMNVMILVGGFWGEMHLPLTIAMAICGAMLGNYLGYWIGKWYGKELIERYGDWFGVGETEAHILHGQIERNGFWYVVLGKFHNFTRAFIPFIAGSGGMSEGRFWLYNMVGSIIWAMTIILIGVFFVDHYEVILDHFGKIATGLFVIIGCYIFFYRREAFRSYIKAKEAEILRKEEARIKKRNSQKTS